jgi:hypothetical protein
VLALAVLPVALALPVLPVALALPVLPVALALAVLPVALALLVLAVVLALPVLAVALDPLAAVDPPADEAAVALVLPARAFSIAATVFVRADANGGVVLADAAVVEGEAGAAAAAVGALEAAEDAGGEAGRVSLLVATIVWPPAWSTVVLFVPLSTLMTVSAPRFATVTCGPWPPPPPSEMFEPEPEYPSTTLPVTSFVTRTVV